MFAAGQRERALHRTLVVDVNAALQRALVATAAPFFRALFLAAGVVGPRGQLRALEHLIHVAASAFHAGLSIALRAWAGMTLA